jgi:hypothetical protein
MRRMSRKGVAIASAAALAAGVGGVAIAATGGTVPFTSSSFLDDLAGRLGVSTQKLKDASKAAALDQVDAALKAGTITQAQADALKTRINAGDGVPFLGGRGFGFGVHGGIHGLGFGVRLDAAATYLGLTDDALRQKLEAGQTLAQIAQATDGKSVAGLKQALLDAATKQLDQAVSDKRITADQEKSILADLSSRVDELVNGTLPARPGPGWFRGDEHPPAPGFSGGPPALWGVAQA